jgi:peptidoglycan-N-acetylglucosamine deacetylase
MPLHLQLLFIFLCIFLAQTANSVEPVIVEHGPRDSKKISLTFDACPTGREDEYDEKVVEVLVREKVSATLFMSGRWVEKNKDTARSLAANPQFEIANHAFWHPHMLEKDDERILRELKRTQDIIRRVTGKRPMYFRPPFGEVDERLARLAAQAGLVTVQYDIASGDPDPGLSAKRIIRGVVGEAKGGSIVVFHMNENGPRTAEVLPEVIRQLREKGFDLVTVGEMLKDQSRSRHGGTETQRKAEKQKKYEALTNSTATTSMISSPVETAATPTAETLDALHTIVEQTTPGTEQKK